MWLSCRFSNSVFSDWDVFLFVVHINLTAWSLFLSNPQCLVHPIALHVGVLCLAFRHFSGSKHQYFGHLMQRVIGKDPDIAKYWRQEEKVVTEGEMVGWHHRLDGHEFEKPWESPWGQCSLCCGPWSRWVTEQQQDLRASVVEFCVAYKSQTTGVACPLLTTSRALKATSFKWSL